MLFMFTVYVRPAALDSNITDENGITLQFSPAAPQIVNNKDLKYNNILKFDGIHQGCLLTCRDTDTNITWKISSHCNDWNIKVQGLPHGREYGFVLTPLTLEGPGAESDEFFVFFPEFGKSNTFSSLRLPCKAGETD